MIDQITRREKLYAKLCWPQIDTQRTKFCIAEANRVYLPVYDKDKVEWVGDDGPVVPAIQLSVEAIDTRWWIAVGKRISVKARWAYSERLDTVYIRSLSTALTDLLYVPSSWLYG